MTLTTNPSRKYESLNGSQTLPGLCKCGKLQANNDTGYCLECEQQFLSYEFEFVAANFDDRLSVNLEDR